MSCAKVMIIFEKQQYFNGKMHFLFGYVTINA